MYNALNMTTNYRWKCRCETIERAFAWVDEWVLTIFIMTIGGHIGTSTPFPTEKRRNSWRKADIMSMFCMKCSPLGQ